MSAVDIDRKEVVNRTFLDELSDFVRRNPDGIFLHGSDDIQSWTRQEFVTLAGRLAAQLTSLGVHREEAVGLLLGNIREYYLVDTATLFVGGVPVSLYPTASVEQLGYMIQDAGVSLLFTETAYLPSLAAQSEQFEGITTIVTVDGPPPGRADDYPWTVLGLDALLAQEGDALKLEDAAAAAHAEELLTLVYTSGTTGAPKGVRLSHKNLLSAARSMGALMQMEEGDRIIAWLPHAHVAGRNGQYYCPVIFGLEVTLCPDPKMLPHYLNVVRPTWFFAVPRVWEKLKAGIEAEFARLPAPTQAEIQTAMATNLLLSSEPGAAATLSDQVHSQLLQMETAVFAPLRAKLGLDQARALNTGTAPTPVHVLEFFAGLGLLVSDIFGATETCACGTIGRPGVFRPGSAGTVVPGMEIQIAEDGEILLRGRPVMQGYHNKPDETAEVMTEGGWYKTGDVGRLDDDGFLWVTDRKKELIINSSGKNMSPANIEAMIKSGHPLIGQACVIGNQRPFNVALLVLDPDYAPAWASGRGIDLSTTALAGHPDVQAAVAEGVANGNSRLSRVEQIKRYTVLDVEWHPGGDELTSTMKLRRKAIEQKYQAQIEQLYAGT
ncbi:MAG TPA: AMP-dependent synthetase/ligase [Marinobacter sp.]|nr:AMP-dependent synthetase/ligase [Marinobacter sp.]